MKKCTLDVVMRKFLIIFLLGLLLIAFNASAEPILMSADWASEACRAWNEEESLTRGLKESGWINNDKDRGYKILHVYRTDCTSSKPVELRIVERDDIAKCVYGGQIVHPELDRKVDYLMHAKTERWIQMGEGKYGPMKAMMFRRLKFKGPKGEAMGNMGPFKSFLLLTGKVPSDTSACP